ncbi:MAG: M23 family metallopeptidase [Cocleimonas sp.]
MKVVLISDNGNYHKRFTVKLWSQFIVPLLLALVLVYSAIAVFKDESSLFSTAKSLASKDDKQAFTNFNSVLQQLSALDAEVQRLNTLSSFIATKNKVDINDFGLTNVPARGGAVFNVSSASNTNSYFGSSIVRHKDVETSVKNLESKLEKQKNKLRNLVVSLEIREAEGYLSKLSSALGLNGSHSAEKSKKVKASRNSLMVYDFSTPLKKGYISSPYGKRRDPINGSARHHNGLDIAAKTGTEVYAIANGFVTFKGRKGAYGNLLELNHSESLKSRYAHLSAFSVKQGDMVRKGDVIGKVGATGRVTGPHLHLEIKENNKIIDPKVYLKNALKSL